MTDWTQVGALATGAGALVTGLGMGLIAWQARETRRTAEAGHAGVEVGRRSLEVAQGVAVDSTKARLDARAPRLWVRAASTRDEVVMGHGGSGFLQPWPIERTFRRTDDDYQQLILGAQVDVKNEGDRSQRVWIDGDAALLRPEGGDISTSPGRITVFLNPGESCEFRLTISKPLHEWAAAWDARKAGNTDAAKTVGHVICSDPYDEGVIDRWAIELWAYPVENIPGDLAGWKIRNGATNPPVVDVAVLQQTRDYYLSKHENRRLEPPALQA